PSPFRASQCFSLACSRKASSAREDRGRLAMRLSCPRTVLLALVVSATALTLLPGTAEAKDPAELPLALASSTAKGSTPRGALDGDRFSADPAKSWRGWGGERLWWWQVTFPKRRTVGAILLVMGDHDIALRNAPKTYVWQAGPDGRAWEDLPETAV